MVGCLKLEPNFGQVHYLHILVLPLGPYLTAMASRRAIRDLALELLADACRFPILASPTAGCSLSRKSRMQARPSAVLDPVRPASGRTMGPGTSVRLASASALPPACDQGTGRADSFAAPSAPPTIGGRPKARQKLTSRPLPPTARPASQAWQQARMGALGSQVACCQA